MARGKKKPIEVIEEEELEEIEEIGEEEEEILEEELEEIEEEELEEEEEIEELPALTLEALLAAYLAALEKNGKKAPQPLPIWEVYGGLSEIYPEPADFADALTRLVDSRPPNNVRGYECDIKMEGEKYKTIAFSSIKPARIPRQAETTNGRGQELVPSKPDQKEEKGFSELLKEVREGYDKALALQKGCDQAFYEAEIKKTAYGAKFEAGKAVYIVERNLRAALDGLEKTMGLVAVQKALEDLSRLRESLGYKTR